jgi:hypothetical protein
MAIATEKGWDSAKLTSHVLSTMVNIPTQHLGKLKVLVGLNWIFEKKELLSFLFGLRATNYDTYSALHNMARNSLPMLTILDSYYD